MRKSGQLRVRSGIPMLELIIAIGLFAVISTFLLRMFLTSDRIRSEAELTSKATIMAQSTLEYLYAGEDEQEAFAALGMAEVAEGDRSVMVAYYDSHWVQTDTVSDYTMKIYRQESLLGEGSLVTYDLTVQKEASEKEGKPEKLFSVIGKKYRRGTVAAYGEEEYEE